MLVRERSEQLEHRILCGGAAFADEAVRDGRNRGAITAPSISATPGTGCCTARPFAA